MSIHMSLKTGINDTIAITTTKIMKSLFIGLRRSQMNSQIHSGKANKRLLKNS